MAVEPQKVTKPFEVIQFKEPYNRVDQLPRAPFPYYVMTKEGLYTRGVNSLGRYIIPTKSLDRLDSLGGDKGGIFWWDASRIPAHIMSQMVDFFSYVWDELKAEAELLLFYNEEIEDENERWKLFCPRQEVSGGSVDSDYTMQMDEFPEGYQLVGTGHSHCNFGAHHSSIDDKDAKDFNGIHITVGHVDDDVPEFDCFVSVNGINFPHNYNLFKKVANVEDIRGYKAPNEDWIKVVTHEKELPKKKGESTYVYGPRGGGSSSPGGQYWYGQTRWSTDFRRNVPIALFDDKTHDLSDVGFMITLADVLNEFRSMALEHGLDVSWQMSDFASDVVIDTGGPDPATLIFPQKKEQEEEGNEEVEVRGESETFLPGPMEVRDPREALEQQRQRLQEEEDEELLRVWNRAAEEAAVPKAVVRKVKREKGSRFRIH